MDKRSAEQYLNSLFGTTTGHVAVAYKDQGDSWQECQFEWPKDRSKLLGWAQVHQDANIFICPGLRSDPHTRKKGDGINLRWLWADVDWDKVPAEKRTEVNKRIGRLGTMIVASGSQGNLHVYVDLGKPVDVREHLRLNTGLRDYLYADNKQSDNSLLRLPGTINWKTQRGSAVALEQGHSKVVTPASLLRLKAFSSVSVMAMANSGPGTSDWALVDISGLPRRVRSLARMETDEAVSRYGNRHKAVWAVTGELHKAGLDPDMIHSLMDQFPPGVEKRDEEHGAYDIHKDVDKRLAIDKAVGDAATAIVESMDEDDDSFEEVSDEQIREQLIAEGVQKELLRRSIRKAADTIEATTGHTEPPADASESLSDALSAPPAPVQYLIDGLVSATGTVVITGQYKSGKTHLMVASLITSLADNEPFLGVKEVHVPEGGAIVGHWNLEMSRLDLIDKYMRPAGFRNTDNVKIAHWQGYRLNILTEPGKAAAVEWLTARQVQVWTIDSWSALCRMCGVDPNDNKEVGDLLGAITEIKVEAKVDVCFLLAHTARASAESDKPGTRGASALDEGVDTRWMFTVDKSDVRFLQAEGRGTQMSAVSLDFNEDTGRSVIGSVSRQSAAQYGGIQLVVKTLKDMGPGKGLDQATLMRKLREVKGGSVRKLKEYVTDAEDGGFIKVVDETRPGGGRARKMHYLAEAAAPVDDSRMNGTPREVDLSDVGVPRRRLRPNSGSSN